MTPDITPLLEKYRTLLALRVEHERARAEARAEPPPTVRLRQLAARFPGALRELDALPLELVRARIVALEEAVLRGPLEPWMVAQAVYHEKARRALWAKRWLGGVRDVDAKVVADFEAAAARAGWEDAAWCAASLARIARPPRGRISAVVFEETARVLGCSVSACRALVLDATGAP